LKTADETKVLASMPSRETLLGRLVGSMKSPISALARFFDAAKKDLEAKDVAKVRDLKNATPKKAEAPKEEVKVEAPAVVVETPAPEAVVPETPVVEETAPVTKESVPVPPTIEATIEVKEEETQTETPAEVVAEVAPVEEASAPEEAPVVEEEKKAE
jgi:hypothetical protein